MRKYGSTMAIRMTAPRMLERVAKNMRNESAIRINGGTDAAYPQKGLTSQKVVDCIDI